VEETIVAGRRSVQRRADDIEGDAILGVMSEGIVVQDAEGRVVRANPAAFSLLGLSEAELIGLSSVDPWWHAVHEDGSDWPVASHPATEVLEKGQAVRNAVMGVYRSDRSLIWLNVNSVPAVVDDDARVVRVVTAFTDITTRIVSSRAELTAERDMATQSDRWRRLLDELPEMAILEVQQDPDGQYRYLSVRGRALMAHGYRDIVGQTVAQVASKANRAEILAAYDAAFAGDPQERTMQHPDGWWLQASLIPLGVIDGLPRVMVVFRDVSRERARESALSKAEERFRRMFAEAPSGNLVHDLDGKILSVNRALCTTLAVEERHIVGQSIADIADGFGFELENIRTGWLTAQTGRATGEYALTRLDGSTVHLAFESVTLVDKGGEPEEVLVHVADVSERRRFESQLAHLADHDPLTDLFNRRRFEQELSQHMTRGERYGHRGAMILLDLDNFKRVNDSLGHNAGDELILSVASVLRKRLRSSDVIARLGGDEFAVLLPSGGRESAERLATKLVESIRSEVTVFDANRSRRITASLGVVLINKHGLTPIELMKQADLAMYDSKEAGRDRYTLLDLTESSRSKSAAHTVWADRIEAALEEDRFVLHAQPILDLRTGVVESAELLVRMLDEDGALVPPGRFLYVAERIGLITQIDEWVVGQAASLLKRIQLTAPDFRVEVNLSGRSMGSTRLSEHIRSTVLEAGINPSGLVLEVTETAAVSDIQSARTFAEELQRAGCRFALDDFGAGFGSFYYLKHLPFDFLKIDGEFVVKCATTPADQVILTAIVDIARGMKKETIAEFVGDQLTLDTIRRTGVDHAQGYFIGTPVPVDELVPMARIPLN
jgi:diguanylate cyclase (GGDEF)-like protein/PAS domain S-box-containing protein